MSEVGLIEMTRKRVKKSLNRMVCEPCFYCEGEGYLLSKQSICYGIYREILRDTKNIKSSKISLITNPEIAELLQGDENHIILSLEEKTGKQIIITPNRQLHQESFEIIEIL